MSDKEYLDISNTSPPKTLSYENCIIREHNESDDDSTSSVFSWRTSQPEVETSMPESSEESADEYSESTLKVNVKESFILMVGFLNQIEKYLDGRSDDRREREDLKQQSILIRTILLNSARSFGYDELQNINGAIYINENSNQTVENGPTKTQQSTQRSPKIPKKNHVDDQTLIYNEAKNMNNEMEINSAKLLSERNETIVTPKRSLRVKNMNDETKINSPKLLSDKNETMVTGRYSLRVKNRISASEKIDKKPHLKKRANEGSVQRCSKRRRYSFCENRLSRTASKLKQVMSKQTTENCNNKRNKSLDLKSAKRARVESDFSNEATCNSSDTTLAAAKNTRTQARRANKEENTRRSEKRKLYCQDSWLDSLITSAK